VLIHPVHLSLCRSIYLSLCRLCVHFVNSFCVRAVVRAGCVGIWPELDMLRRQGFESRGLDFGQGQGILKLTDDFQFRVCFF